MNVIVIASSSKGNCLILDNEVMLDCGLPLNQIKKGSGYRLSAIQGCLISHFHGDHAKAAKDIMGKACIELYTAKETAEALNLTGHRLHIIEPEKQFKVGNWTAMGFPTEHDAAGSLGFLLQKDDIKVMYMVDSLYTKYLFKGLTHILISCNYDSDILRDNVNKGLINPNLANRILANHMSLSSCKQFFLDNDMSQLQGVWLLHLSDLNSDAENFKKEIQAITGKPVFIG